MNCYHRAQPRLCKRSGIALVLHTLVLASRAVDMSYPESLGYSQYV